MQTVHLHILFQECAMLIVVQIGFHIFKSIQLHSHYQIFIVMQTLWVSLRGFWISKTVKYTICIIFFPKIECTANCSISSYFLSHIRKWNWNMPSRSRGVWWAGTIIPHSIHEFIPMANWSQNNSCQVFYLYKLLPAPLVEKNVSGQPGVLA